MPKESCPITPRSKTWQQNSNSTRRSSRKASMWWIEGRINGNLLYQLLRNRYERVYVFSRGVYLFNFFKCFQRFLVIIFLVIYHSEIEPAAFVFGLDRQALFIQRYGAFGVI